MRYYRVIISDPQTGEVLVPNVNGNPGFSRVGADPTVSTYTSLLPGTIVTQYGSANMAAQRVEIDMATTFFHQPVQNNAYLRIWGVGLAEVGQASNLNGLNIAVYGGMSAGLPLANPSQSGLLASGQVWQAFGNWAGVNMTLDIYLAISGSSPSSSQTTGNPSTTGSSPSVSTIDTPANIVFQWQPGESLLTPTVSTLSQAYPKYQIQGAVDPKLVWSGAPATGFFANLKQFAEWVNQKSLSIISGYAPPPGGYPGVGITLQDNIITITDQTTQTNPKQIQFIDLVGQPTWSAPYTVQATCVMRADIKVGDWVTLPQLAGIIQQGSNSQFFNVQPGNVFATQKSGSVFTGTFYVTAVRHVGDSRNPDGMAWVTTLDLRNFSAPSQVDSLPVLYSGNTTYAFFLPGATT